jgi:four helix bundle protein
MNYERFEDLRVWQDAIELAVRVFSLTARPNFKCYGGLKDQIEQAVVSISNNIAEGFERGTTPELLASLNISRGSSGETRSLSCLIDCLPGFADLRSEISDLRTRAESISRQLRAWSDSMQNSEIRGQRYLAENVAVPRRKRASVAGS